MQILIDMKIDFCFLSLSPSLFPRLILSIIFLHLATRLFFPLALRRTITFTSRVEKPRHWSLEMYSRRLVLQHCITDRYESTLRIVTWTPKRGQIDLSDRSWGKFSTARARVIARSYFDKDRSNIICNASSVLASWNIDWKEEQNRKNLMRENQV